jgi:hypothetical protein
LHVSSINNITAFIATVAEAQAQAVIAAAAEAASGSGPATAIARGVASIQAARAAAAAAGNDGMNVADVGGKGAILLRGLLHVPMPPPVPLPAATAADEGVAAAAEGTETAASTMGERSVMVSSSNSSSFDISRTWHRKRQQQEQQQQQQQQDFPADTFLDLGDGWGRGEVWVNGKSLGRYWPGQGPQMSLYLPGVWLQYGQNEVVVLELDGKVPVEVGMAAGAGVGVGDTDGIASRGSVPESSSVDELGSTGGSRFGTFKDEHVSTQWGQRQEGGQGQHLVVQLVSRDVPDFSGPAAGPEPLY